MEIPAIRQPSSSHDNRLLLMASERLGSAGAEPEQSTAPNGVAALIEVIKRRRSVLGGAVVLGAVLSLLATAMAEPRYTATAQILALPRSTQVFELTDNNLPTSSESAFVDNQVEILKSSTLLERLTEKLRLKDINEFKYVKDSRSLLSYLNPLSWLRKDEPASTITQDQAEPATDPATVKIINQLRGQISIKRVGVSQLISINATSTSPRRAAELANTLVDLYLVDQLDTRIDSIKRTNSWLDSQLEDLRTKLQKAEQAVEQYRAANNLLDIGGKSMTDQQRADFNSQLVNARADLAEKEARRQQMADILQRGGDVQTLNEVLQSDVISRLRAQQAEIARRQAELSSRYGDLHPSVVNIKAEMADVERQIVAESRRIMSNLDNEAAVARARLNTLTSSLGQLDRSAAVNERAMVRLGELQREANSTRQLYESLLEGYKKSFVLGNSDSADPVARKTSEAIVPNHPSYPNTGVFLSIGIILSLAISVALIALLEALDRGFRSAEQVQQYLGLPHLSSVPLVNKKTLKDARAETIVDYIMQAPTSIFVESLRKLRSSLVFSNVDNPPRVIMVTSSLPDEGKSTLACALAASLAASGHKTLLIDADMRNPSVAGIMSAEPEIGLPELLSGEASLADAVVRHEGARLDCIYSVQKPSNSADLLDSRAMSDLLAGARSRYAYVILDCPPVLPIVDPLVLARKVDSVVFSIRWELTPRDATLAALRKLRQAETRVAGFVLNVVDLQRMARNSVAYGDENYYSGRYTKYYADGGREDA